MLHIVYKGLILFGYTKTVSPFSRSHSGVILIRFHVAVRFPAFTRRIHSVDPNSFH